MISIGSGFFPFASFKIAAQRRFLESVVFTFSDYFKSSETPDSWQKDSAKLMH